MTRAEDGTIIVGSLKELTSILRKKKEGTMYSIYMGQSERQEGSIELPFPDLPSLESDDVIDTIREGEFDGEET